MSWEHLDIHIFNITWLESAFANTGIQIGLEKSFCET